MSTKKVTIKTIDGGRHVEARRQNGSKIEVRAHRQSQKIEPLTDLERQEKIALGKAIVAKHIELLERMKAMEAEYPEVFGSPMMMRNRTRDDQIRHIQRTVLSYVERGEFEVVVAECFIAIEAGNRLTTQAPMSNWDGEFLRDITGALRDNGFAQRVFEEANINPDTVGIVGASKMGRSLINWVKPPDDSKA